MSTTWRQQHGASLWDVDMTSSWGMAGHTFVPVDLRGRRMHRAGTELSVSLYSRRHSDHHNCLLATFSLLPSLAVNQPAHQHRPSQPCDPG